MLGDAEPDDGCSGSRFGKLRLLAAGADRVCTTDCSVLMEQMVVILKSINSNFCPNHNHQTYFGVPRPLCCIALVRE